MPAALYLSLNPRSPRVTTLMRPIVVEHQARYVFAGQVLNGYTKVIADAASGCGWGANYLAENTQANVMGIDFNRQALAEAKRYFTHPRLDFYQADLLDSEQISRLPRVDSVVSFETLEHFPKESVPQFLANLKRLCPDGQLIISSPNGPLFSPYFPKEGRPWFPYHYIEYNPSQLAEILQSNGWRVEQMFGQRFVDSDLYFKWAKALYPIRFLLKKTGMSWTDKISRLPFSLLHRLAALCDTEEVREITNQPRQPIFLTALCS